MISAREIYKNLGYTKWSNFNGVIKRAINLINIGTRKGNITEAKYKVNLPKGAIRFIRDYKMDENAFEVVKELSSSYKLNNFYGIRNEIAIVNLIKKYCDYKGIKFEFQHYEKNYRYDCFIGDRVLVEFDEPHHQQDYKQKNIDSEKNRLSRHLSYKIIRITLEDDIIDIIKMIDAEFNLHKTPAD